MIPSTSVQALAKNITGTEAAFLHLVILAEQCDLISTQEKKGAMST
jgi:hypothetical protein